MKRALAIGLGFVAILAAFVLATQDNTAHVNTPAAIVSQLVATNTPGATRTGQLTQTSTPGPVQQTPSPTATPLPLGAHPVYVVDPQNGGLLSQVLAIDADALRVVGQLQTRYEPVAALSPDGTRLFIADTYYTEVTRGAQIDALSVFDARTLQLLVDDVPIPGRSMPQLGSNSDWFFLSQDGRRLFISQYGTPGTNEIRLRIVDVSTFQTLGEIGQPSCYNDQFQLLPNGQFSCVIADGIDYIDPLTNISRLALGLSPGPIQAGSVLAPTGDRLYLLTPTGNVTVIDVTSEPPRVVASRITLDLPAEYQTGYGHGLVISPDESRLYIALYPTAGPNLGSGTAEQIWVFSTHTWRRLGVFVPSDPAFDFAVSGDGRQLYMVNPYKRTLSIFDTDNFQEIGVMYDVGTTPAHILVPRTH